MGKIIVARSNSPRSVSMTPANADYYDSLTKGHKSAMVNRAMDNYRGDGFSTHELLANIEGLQQVIAVLHEENPPGPVALGLDDVHDEVNEPRNPDLVRGHRGPVASPESTSLMGGLRAILARIWPF